MKRMIEKTEEMGVNAIVIAIPLLFLLLMVAVCPAGALSPGDLPGPGEELVITSDDVLIIAEGETAELGGKLIVRGTGGVRPTLQIENRGEFILNGSITGDNAEVNLTNMVNGNLTGGEQEFVSEHASITVSNYGGLNIENFNSSVTSGAFSIKNYGQLFMQNTSFYAQSGDGDQRELMLFFNRGDALLNCTSLTAATGGLIKLENEGALQMNNLSCNSYSTGTIRICNHAGQMNFHNLFVDSQGPNSEISIVIEDGEFTVENLNLGVSGGIIGIYVESGGMHVGTLNAAVTNAGHLCIVVSDGADATFMNSNISCGDWNSSGVISIENYGQLFMQNTSFYAQSGDGDQRELMLFFNRGDALLNCTSLTVATGGLIKLENEGALQMNNLSCNSYSTGTIRICNHAGQMNFHNFWSNLSGWSQMSIWNNDILTVSEEFNIIYEDGTFDIYPLEQGVVYTLFANGEMLLNHQAYEPSNPNPGNQAEDVAYDTVTLSWEGGDPDGDPVTYDLYFGTVEDGVCHLPESPTVSGLTETNYGVSYLAPSTTYCWKVVAHENEACTMRGSIWTFNTGEEMVARPVPTLTEWSRIILLLVLAGTAILVLRRRA